MRRYDGLINSVGQLENALRVAEQEMIATIISNSYAEYAEPYEVNGIDYEKIEIKSRNPKVLCEIGDESGIVVITCVMGHRFSETDYSIILYGYWENDLAENEFELTQDNIVLGNMKYIANALNTI